MVVFYALIILNWSYCCSKSGQISQFLLAKWRRQKSQRLLFEGVLEMYLSLSLYLSSSLSFVDQVMFSHHSDQMSQRSKVSKIAL